MAEAQRGSATLEDVNEGTFVRFIEWAHKGYYTAADFRTPEIESPCTSGSQDNDELLPGLPENYVWKTVPRPSSKYDFEFQAVPERPTDADKFDAMFRSVPSYKKGKTTKVIQDLKGELKEAFISRRYTVRQGVSEIPPPRPNQNPEEDYTDVFLSHAQLYVFAEKYDIQPLKVLALEELHATLAIYTLYLVRTGDIIALLRYVYGNTGESEGVEGDLRNVLTIYIGYEMDTLMKDEDFRDVMIEDGGPLLGDFMRMVRKRIS